MIGLEWVRKPRLRGALVVALALGCVGPAQFAQSAPRAQDVLRATLDNGLRVIIVRNRLAPVVSTAVNYLAGSDETPNGFPGTAHAMEHIMFRGSPGLSADQLANIGSIMGGNFNANTRESLTQYLFTVPSEDLDVALHIEAIRMQDIIADKADWDKERGAIEQEVAQDLSNPSYILYARLRAAVFAGTPYAHDALGTRPSFEATTAEMLGKFHKDWYAPNNAILVIAGDVDPAATLARVKTLFGVIKPKNLPTRPGFKFAPPKASSFTLETDRPNATAIVAMRFPGLDSADFPALEVLADVLSSHRFDLYGLVPAGKALDADFSLDALPRASLGYASVSFPAGGDAKAVEADIRAILAKVAHDGVPAELVEAAKQQERRQTEFQKNGIEGLASVWSDAVALYGLDSPEQDLARIEKISVADVNRVARKYLALDTAVTAVMLPKGSGRAVASGAGFGGQENIALGEAKPTPLPDWAEATLNRLDVPPSTTHPIVSTLPNGLTLIVQPEDVSDTVSIYGHVRNRPETEMPPGQEGVSQILEQLFPYGSESRDRLAYETALDEIGASETAGADFAIQVLAPDFDRGAELLSDNQLHPALPAEAFDILQNQMVRVVAARNKSPSYLASRAVRTAVFPKDDPILRDATPGSIAALKRDDVLAYYKRVMRPDMTTIVVIGNITPEKARATIEKYFGGWTATGPKPPVDLPNVADNRSNAFAVPDDSRVQDNVIMAHNIALNRSNPDYYALSLGNSVLGGGFYSSRFSIDLRKNAGLVYSVGSQLQVGRTRANYFIQYACDPQNVVKAADLIAREIKAMQTTPVGPEELARSKMLLLRQMPLGEDSISDIARGFLGRRDLDLPLDEPSIAAKRYVALTAAEVQAAFAKWMRPGDLVRVSQGPAPQ